MNSVNQTRLRILIKTGENEFRKFYWFEMKDKELYWGSSSKMKNHIAPVKSDSDNKIKVQIPREFHESKIAAQKFSYHKSGQLHVKSDSDNCYKKLSVWCGKEDIKISKRFFVVESKTVSNYPLYLKNNLTANKTNVIAIEFPRELMDSRLYIEFYICPLDHFDPKPPLLFRLKSMRHFFHRLNNDLLLAGVFSIITIPEDQAKDYEFSFVPDIL